jgi:hypothetical protein
MVSPIAQKGAQTMRLKKQRPAPAAAAQKTTTPTEPAWQELLDQPERPNREDIGAQQRLHRLDAGDGAHAPLAAR